MVQKMPCMPSLRFAGCLLPSLRVCMAAAAQVVLDEPTRKPLPLKPTPIVSVASAVSGVATTSAMLKSLQQLRCQRSRYRDRSRVPEKTDGKVDGKALSSQIRLLVERAYPDPVFFRGLIGLRLPRCRATNTVTSTVELLPELPVAQLCR